MAQDERLPALNALRAFEAAGRHLSFTRAADELNVTPGAISQQIRQLEEFAGAPLFRRTGRQVLLTDAGQAALPLLSNAFEMMSEAVHHMKAPARRDRLMISSAPSFAAKWLAHRLDRFQEEHPEAEVWVSADLAITDFNSTDIDLAIRYGKGIYDGLRIEKVLSESVLPVCSPDLMKGSHPLHKPEDLAHHVLLHDEGPETDPSCPDWKSWLAARGVTSVDTSRGPHFSQSALVVEPPPLDAASPSPSTPSPPPTSNAAGWSRPSQTARPTSTSPTGSSGRNGARRPSSPAPSSSG